MSDSGNSEDYYCETRDSSSDEGGGGPRGQEGGGGGSVSPLPSDGKFERPPKYIIYTTEGAKVELMKLPVPHGIKFHVKIDGKYRIGGPGSTKQDCISLSHAPVNSPGPIAFHKLLIISFNRSKHRIGANASVNGAPETRMGRKGS